MAWFVGLLSGPLAAFGELNEPRLEGTDSKELRNSIPGDTPAATAESVVIDGLMTAGELLTAEALVVRGARPRAADLAGARLVEVSIGAVDHLLTSNGPIELRNIPIGDDLTADFDLTPIEVFSEDAEVFRIVDGQPVPAPFPEVRFFKGRGIDNAESTILLSVADGGRLFAHMRAEGETTLINAVQSEARGTTHMMVDGAAVSGTPLGDLCSSGNLLQHQEALANMPEEEAHVMPRTGELIEAEIMVDINFGLIANAFGGNVDAATTYALNIVAASSAIYERDLSMRLTVSQLFYWDQGDPFSASSSDGQLESYQQYCINERGQHERDLAILMADLDGAGGIAYLDAVCNPQVGYAVANMEIDTTFPAQGYSWDLVVVTHELGHNFGSPHTHCYSPPIDRCFAECYPEVVPQVGTIMSYCHLGGHGIDTQFHERVVNQIRGRVVNAGCLNVSQGGGGNGGGSGAGGCNGQADDAFEPNDGFNQARAIQPGQHQLQGCNDDVFSVNVPTSGRITVTIAGSQGDLDLFLFTEDEQPVADSVSNTSNESIQVDVPAGTFLIGVTPYEGQGSDYMLQIDIEGAGGGGGSCNGQPDDAFEPNDDFPQARAIQPGVHQLQGCNADVFSVEAQSSGRMTVTIAGSQGDLDLFLFTEDEQPLAESVSNTSNESVQLDVTAGTFLIGILPYEGQGSAYTLNIEIESTGGGSGNGGGGNVGTGNGETGNGGAGNGSQDEEDTVTICVDTCGACASIPGAGLIAGMFFLGGCMRRRYRRGCGRDQPPTRRRLMSRHG